MAKKKINSFESSSSEDTDQESFNDSGHESPNDSSDDSSEISNDEYSENENSKSLEDFTISDRKFNETDDESNETDGESNETDGESNQTDEEYNETDRESNDTDDSSCNKTDEKSNDTDNSDVNESEIMSEKEINQSKNHSYERKKPPEASPSWKKKDPIIPKSSTGGIWYYKKNACPYCDKVCPRVDRHITSGHKDKKTVQKINSLAIKNPLRKKLLGMLRKIGNERYNKDPFRNPNKVYIVTRRLASNIGKKIPYLKNKKQKEAEKMKNDLADEKQFRDAKIKKYTSTGKQIDKIKSNKNKAKKNNKKKSTKKKFKKESKKYKKKMPTRVICPVCRGYYATNSYSKHFTKSHGDMKNSDTRYLIKVAKRELEEYHPLASLEMIRYLIPHLRDDTIGIMCQHDELAIRYGNKYLDQYDPEDQVNLVKGHMRLAMKVLHQMKTLNSSITDLESCFQGEHFDSFIEAAKIICKVNKKVMGVPYNGHTIRMLWNRFMTILKAKYSTVQDCDKRRRLKENLQNYNDIFTDGYASKIGSKATRGT